MAHPERQRSRTVPGSSEARGGDEPAPAGGPPALLAWGGLLAGLGLAILCLVRLDGDIKDHHDSAVYVSLASSLATGQGYSEIFFEDARPHTKYPPLFPALLAPIVLAFGRQVLAMKLVVLVSALLSLGALYALCRRRESGALASLVVMFTATSHGIVFFTQSVMTEIPYLLFSLLALLWLQELSAPHGWTVRSVGLAVVLVSAAYLTRLVGLSLLFAATAWTLIDAPVPLRIRARRAAVLAVVGAAPALVWLARNRRFGEPAGSAYDWGLSAMHADQSLGALGTTALGRVGANLVKYVRHSARVILFDAPALSDVALPLGLALMIAAGFVGCVLLRRTVLEYYVTFYAAAVVLFPGTRPQRYLVPLIPLVWYYFFIAARAIHRFLSPRVPRRPLAWVTVATLALLLVLNVRTTVQAEWVLHGRDGYYLVAGEDGYRTAAIWARTHTAPDSVMLWAKPALRFLLSERRGVRPPSRRQPPSPGQPGAPAFDYVVIDSFSEKGAGFLAYALARYGTVCPVYRDAVSEILAVGRRCVAEGRG